MQFEFRPILTWPGQQTARRQRSRFRAGKVDTDNLLRHELEKLKAKNVVIQLALTPADIRIDGLPRAGARPTHPGVILAFDSKHGPLSYPCDTYDAWEDNLRAIALALEALRAVDRYGVTRRAEQYRGWQQLPENAGGGDLAWAVRNLAQLSGIHLDPARPDKLACETAYRAGLRRCHPDTGGSDDAFKQLQAVKAIIEQHFGAKP